MDEEVSRVRSFNRTVTETVGALDQSYLKRGRPLGEARLLFEVGLDGADVKKLREKLRLDSGYLSRLLRSLAAQGLIEVRPDRGDRRRRRATLTRKGRAERAAYDRLSDRLAASLLERLDPGRRERLLAAMEEVERLVRAAAVEVGFASPRSADARWCLENYFRELAERFNSGFDPARDPSGPEEDLTPPSGRFVVARLKGEPVGCGVLKRVDETTGEIKRVWTAPSARGLGVARRVLGKLEAAAREAGLRILRLDTNRALTEAHALYRKAHPSHDPIAVADAGAALDEMQLEAAHLVGRRCLLPYRSEPERQQKVGYDAFIKPSGSARFLRAADGQSRT